ncbi:unnamed protein product [Heterobilharzia americana]|nr:unnamed protein product [Heterobilharzia americana]
MEAINNKHYYVFKAFIVDELWNSLRNVYLQAIGLSRNSSSSHNAKVSDLENVDCLQQTFTEQDLINCYYQEFGRLLKHSRITSNLNCSCEFVACDQTLDKLTCIIFDRLATLCLYHCGITVYSHASLYHVLFSEEHSVSVNNWSKFWLMPMKNFM